MSSPQQLRSALILYGSETGNAQEVAEELGALTERLRFATHVCELNQSSPVCGPPLYYDIVVTN
jgi:flavodoxin